MIRISAIAIALLVATGCDSDDIDSDTEARWAYLGFDAAIDRALNLGFDGFNAANSANIPEQMGLGDVEGEMFVNGQVDQGTSSNKEMRLILTLVDYEDDLFDDTATEDVEELRVRYNTIEGSEPALDLSLRDFPNGTFVGTLVGTMRVEGEVDEPEADFDIALSGGIMDGGNGTVVREAGTLEITGTVTSGDGVFNVDVMR